MCYVNLIEKMTKVSTVNDISRFSATTVLNDKFMRVEKQLYPYVEDTATILRTNDPENKKNLTTRVIYILKFF